MVTKPILFRAGSNHIAKWRNVNGLDDDLIIINHAGNDPDFGVCAYYRDSQIHIWIDACANIGQTIRQWSYPGYIVDRTPYGVLAHELGHHVDKAHGHRGGTFGSRWRRETGEQPITSYCPDDNEWFGEMFRLFVTNPNLLSLIRPKTYTRMINQWPNLAETRIWRDVLKDAPTRWINATQNHIAKVRQ